ncbi:hypothetical protein EVAR_42971_1 [Eumeta japonica]|uniref:Uncharacterized protein n=1 Tax=Eumeta variegata TaxID=151549 RepID=A0A4C1ZR57_EUMVA|nr:hypothetical protein EVAR_42971_1 [Eumeta japonica]
MDDEEFVGCVSCLNTTDLNDLYIEYSDKIDTYGKMLENCFNIKVSEELKYICTTCIQKLEDAIAFKEQTMKNIAILMSVRDEEYLDESIFKDEVDDASSSGLEKALVLRKCDGSDATNADAQQQTTNLALVCEVCGQESNTRMDLRDHLKRCHSIVTDNEGCCDRFKCHFCENAYGTRKACYTHLRMKHGLKLTNDITPKYEPRERKKCHICTKDFSQTQILNKHLWKEHGYEVERRKAHICPLCDIKVSYGTHFSQHLLMDHNIKEHVEELEFSSMEEFNMYKNEVQETTKCRFRKTTATKRTIEGLRSHYMCSQSGVYVCQGRGVRPAADRQIYKTGKACPAHMVVTEAAAVVKVLFHTTHVGHAECPFYQPRKSKRPKTARKHDELGNADAESAEEGCELICEDCGLVSDDRDKFKSHMATHGRLLFFCQQCEKRAPSRKWPTGPGAVRTARRDVPAGRFTFQGRHLNVSHRKELIHPQVYQNAELWKEHARQGHAAGDPF